MTVLQLLKIDYCYDNKYFMAGTNIPSSCELISISVFDKDLWYTKWCRKMFHGPPRFEPYWCKAHVNTVVDVKHGGYWWDCI